MMRATLLAVLVPALLAGFASGPNAQVAPLASAREAPQTSLPGSAPSTSDAPLANRITGIETNRELIAAEAPTAIVINGSADAHCGLVVDFGDGTRAGNLVSGSSPFPLRLAHTYAKPADFVVRVGGAVEGSAPPCEGAADVAVHVAPAGSKIEYITLTSGCPEGWLLKGRINSDNSFQCAPIADASAPTNLIHCLDGMKYFARDGHVGCRHLHLAALAPEQYPKAKTPMAKTKAPGKGGGMMAKAKTPAMPKAQGKASAKLPAGARVQAQLSGAASLN